MAPRKTMKVRKLPPGSEFYDDEVGAAKGHARSGSKNKTRRIHRLQANVKNALGKARRRLGE